LFGWLCRFDGDGYVALIHCWFWFFLYSSLHVYIYIYRERETHERSSSYDVMVSVDLTSYVLCPNDIYNVERNQSNACLFHNFLVAVEWVKCLVFPFSSLPGLSIIVYLVLLGIVVIVNAEACQCSVPWHETQSERWVFCVRNCFLDVCLTGAYKSPEFDLVIDIGNGYRVFSNISITVILNLKINCSGVCRQDTVKILHLRTKYSCTREFDSSTMVCRYIFLLMMHIQERKNGFLCKNSSQSLIAVPVMDINSCINNYLKLVLVDLLRVILLWADY
jgi:hypothetical protein